MCGYNVMWICEQLVLETTKQFSIYAHYALAPIVNW